MTESSRPHNSVNNSNNTVSVLLSILTIIAVIGALKASYSVTMPLAFALFLIVLAWPLFKWFNARLPEKVAFGFTLLVLVALLAIFFGLLFYSGKVMADAAPRYADEATKMWGEARQSAARYDMTLPENPRQLLKGSGGTSFVGPLLSVLGLWLLVMGLVALGLHEAPAFRAKFQKNSHDKDEKGEALQVLDQIIEKCGRYFWIRTVVSLIQGVCSGLAALALGLDLPFIWGLSAALLNYLPTVGSLISVVPPALFALFQFQDVGRAGFVFFVMCAIQLLLGTFVDPLLSGRQLKVSAFLVLFSIAFWGWVWGIAGALIGVPLTVTLLIVCSHFEATKWIADLFAGDNEPGEATENAK